MDEQLKRIFHDVFGLPPEQFRPDLTSEDIESWDSVMHLTLLLTLEQKFGVSFEPEQGARLTSVPAIKAALAAANRSQN
jgi:acyl carrier protein